jgi:hypothetical protein
MSAGAAGLRIVLIVLDATGRAISASDTVLYRSGADPADVRQESLGGRLTPEGTFKGTRWHTVGWESPESDDVQLQSTPGEPTDEEAQQLTALVAELVRRQAS